MTAALKTSTAMASLGTADVGVNKIRYLRVQNARPELFPIQLDIPGNVVDIATEPQYDIVIEKSIDPNAKDFYYNTDDDPYPRASIEVYIRNKQAARAIFDIFANYPKPCDTIIIDFKDYSPHSHWEPVISFASQSIKPIS